MFTRLRNHSSTNTTSKGAWALLLRMSHGFCRLPVVLFAFCIVFACVTSLQAELGETSSSAKASDPSTAAAPLDGSVAVEPPPLAPLVGARHDAVTAQLLMGSWVAEIADARVSLTFKPGGHFSLDSLEGEYIPTGSQLILRTREGETRYDFELSSGALALRGGDLRKEIRFIRQTEAAEYVASWIELSPDDLKRKFKRLTVVLCVVLFARLTILLLKGISHLLIYSDWGPFALIWRFNKGRVRTIHSLVLNVVKYFVYFSALGVVLSELGVNYATYLASLSVVGLAIGFGSQGLVQDMVTGFFVIFEAQFDVGDMVEVGGQTGVVVELGLRMTKLRNYFGQIVVIPNRNIAVVGKYRLDSQLATIDVAISGPEADAPATKLLTELGREINRQFPGVFLNDPVVESVLPLKTGERFIRLRVLFWPGQLWVIDQQFVPRLREAFKRAGLEIPSDRVVVFYHSRDQLVTYDWRERLKKPFARFRTDASS